MEVTIQLDPGGRQLELFGPADSHLRLLRQSLGIQITARQSNLIISGTEKNVNEAVDVINKMQKHLIKHRLLTTADISAFINRKHSPLSAETSEAITVYSHTKVVEPSTAGQLRYIEAMLANDITFCIGPAGTGKTYLAVAIGD